MLDARHEKVSIDRVIRSQAVMMPSASQPAVQLGGRRQVLRAELANRASASSWKEFLRRLKARVAFVVSDGHEGLREAVTELLTDVAWQRCYVHFLRNALDHLPRKADDNCLRNCAGPTSGAT